MPTAKVYDMTGAAVGEVELSEAVFGTKPNQSVMHSVVVSQLGNKRQGTQSTLTRAEVSGGGAKPWRQKGTGRARQGSTRAPHWTHGGVAFGPKPRDYHLSMNKKARRAAMKSALSAKAAAGTLYVIQDLDVPEIKTKQVIAFLGAIGVSKSALIVTPDPRQKLVRSAHNLPGIRTAVSGSLSVYDILKAEALILDREAVTKLEEVYEA